MKETQVTRTDMTGQSTKSGPASSQNPTSVSDHSVTLNTPLSFTNNTRRTYAASELPLLSQMRFLSPPGRDTGTPLFPVGPVPTPAFSRFSLRVHARPPTRQARFPSTRSLPNQG